MAYRKETKKYLRKMTNVVKTAQAQEAEA